MSSSESSGASESCSNSNVREGDVTKEKSEDMKNVMKAWYNQFTDKSQSAFKHNSTIFNAEQNIQKTITNKISQAMGVALITKLCELTPEATLELKKIDSVDFNIFKLRELTNGHELETVLPFILARHNLIAHNRLDFNYLLNFVKALAMGYKRITYHN